jgi:hypothetical protein
MKTETVKGLAMLVALNRVLQTFKNVLYFRGARGGAVG